MVHTNRMTIKNNLIKNICCVLKLSQEIKVNLEVHDGCNYSEILI